LVWNCRGSGVDSPYGGPLDPQELGDWELMQRVATSDEAAIDALYARFSVLVFQSARQVLGSRAETEDAVQEVFVRLWRTADRFDPNRAKLVTWVMLITRRHLIDRLRRQSAGPEQRAMRGGTGFGDSLRVCPNCSAPSSSAPICKGSVCATSLSSWMPRSAL